MTQDDPTFVDSYSPPPGLRWRCGWVFAHALLFAAPFVTIEGRGSPPPLVALSFPILLAATQIVFLHRHLRPSPRMVPGAFFGFVTFGGMIAIFAGNHQEEVMCMIAPLILPICLSPLLMASGFRHVPLWPGLSFVGLAIGVFAWATVWKNIHAMILEDGGLRNGIDPVGFFLIGLCYGVGGMLGLRFLGTTNHRRGENGP